MPLCSRPAVILRRVGDFLGSGLRGKTTPSLGDGEDTGGLSLDLSAFRCVFRSGVKLGREGRGCPDHPVIHIIPLLLRDKTEVCSGVHACL